MNSKDYLKQIAESKGVCPLTNVVKDNALLFPIGFEYIFKDLDRLEEFEKENQELIKKKADCCLWKDCNKISQENEKLKKAIEIIKKHFIIKLEEETDLNGNVWGRLVSIQSKEDEGTWDTTACANIVNCKEDFDLLEEVLEE